MSTITTKDGTEIYYKDWGEGPVVTFSHGWPLNADAWDGQMLFLAQHGFRVVAHDRRGHGRSGQASSGNDMNGYADDLAAVIEALDLQGRHPGRSLHRRRRSRALHRPPRHGARGRKAVLIAAVPPLMLKTAANPEGLPMEVFDAMRAGLSKDRSQFYKDLAMQFYGANRPGAKVSQGVLDQFWLWSMQAGSRTPTRASRHSPRRTSPRTSRSSTSRRWSCTAKTTRSCPSRTRPENRPGSSRARRRSTIRARRTASRPPIKTRSTLTCWPSSLRKKSGRRLRSAN